MPGEPLSIQKTTDIDVIAGAIVGRHDRRRLLVFLDFDGTICDFALRPEEAVLSAERRALLERLACLPDVTVAIVSGRRLPDIRVRADVGSDAFYAGLHGLEIEWGETTLIQQGVFETEGLLARVAEDLRIRTSSIPGVIVDDKHFSVALHFRAATDDNRRIAEHLFSEVTNEHLKAGRVKLLTGNCVLELLPNISWNKGSAVTKICEEVHRQYSERVWPVYLGDDVTDEDAFAVLRDDGVTVVVGVRPSCARFRVSTPAEIEVLLERVCERWSRRAASTPLAHPVTSAAL